MHVKAFCTFLSSVLERRNLSAHLLFTIRHCRIPSNVPLQQQSRSLGSQMPCRLSMGRILFRTFFKSCSIPPPLSSCPSTHQPPSFHSLVSNAINTPCLRDGVGCSARTNEMCGISVIYVKETRKAVLMLPTKQA